MLWPPCLWQRTTCLLKGATVKEDGRKKENKTKGPRICFQDIFFWNVIKAIFSWGLHYQISVLYCSWVIFLCLFFPEVDFDYLEQQALPHTVFLFYQNQLRSVLDDYDVRVMGIVSIYFFVNIWEYFHVWSTNLDIQSLFNWIWMVMRSTTKCSLCMCQCMSVIFDVNKKKEWNKF